MSKSRPRNRQASAKFKNSSKKTPANENWLWGRHAVLAALENSDRRCLRLVASPNAKKRHIQALQTAQEISPQSIDALLPAGAVHQGIAGQFSALPETRLEDLIAASGKGLVVLDQISDPQNLGAIIRSAAAFGFSCLILQTRHSAMIGGVTAKAAVGALERLAICRVVNIARALETLNKAGFHTIGLSGHGQSDLGQAISGSDRLALILGAEGAGLRPAVAAACAELARIPIRDEVESLNVSAAASIAFYEAQRLVLSAN